MGGWRKALKPGGPEARLIMVCLEVAMKHQRQGVPEAKVFS
jgi:hypothetical protein